MADMQYEELDEADIVDDDEPRSPAKRKKGPKGLRFKGNKLITGPVAKLPPICVCCGSDREGGKMHSKALSYANPLIYLLLLVNLLVLLIVYFIVRKTCTVNYYTCFECTSSLKTKAMINGLVWLAFLGAIVGAIAMESGALGLTGLALFIAGLVTATRASAPIKVAGYNNQRFELKGFSKEFLVRVRAA